MTINTDLKSGLFFAACSDNIELIVLENTGLQDYTVSGETGDVNSM